VYKNNRMQTHITNILNRSTVGIAGLGGLGSTVAAALARAGIGTLIIADFDNVEQSNLNRQHYFADQLGRPKTDATTENLKRINPALNIIAHRLRLTPADIPQVFANADVIAECFDKAEAKQMIVETVLSSMQKPAVVSANGLAGYGKSNAIRTKRISKRLVVVGDGQSGIDTNTVLAAPRVWLAACHQANAIIELLVDEIKP
jgi:sulfur carrier protein ThiS adenylyltransferase